MKDKTTAGLLAFLLGGIGAHKFYLGQFGAGLVYFLFCWTMIPTLLGLIDAIVLLTMDRDAFDRRYNYRLVHQRYVALPPAYTHPHHGHPHQGFPHHGHPHQGFSHHGHPHQGFSHHGHPHQGFPHPGNGHHAAHGPSQPPPSVANELERLHELLLAGAITEQEFAAHKQRLLGPYGGR